MLFTILKAEKIKLKRSPIWIVFLLMPIIPALIGTLNYLGNLELLQSDWYSLWTQHTIFTSYFFLPIMLGVYCSYIMYEEEKNHNWNKVFTMPVPRSLVFISKFITAGEMILLSEIWICVLFIISGKIAGINAVIPYTKIITGCSLGTLGGIVMASCQLTISLFIKNFAVPVGIAFGGGISGLVFLAKGLGHIWPYSLMAYGMGSNAPQELIKSGYGAFVAVCILYILLFTAVSSVILKKRDV